MDECEHGHTKPQMLCKGQTGQCAKVASHVPCEAQRSDTQISGLVQAPLPTETTLRSQEHNNS